MALILGLAGCATRYKDTAESTANLTPIVGTEAPSISATAPRKQHYLFAHSLLPSLFYKGEDGFLGYLESNGATFLGELWNCTGDDVPAQERMPAEGIASERQLLPDGTELYFITLPEPQRVPEAYYLALVIKGERREFLTLEMTYRMPDTAEPVAYFCAWLPNASHVVYGAVNNSGLAGFKQLVVTHLSRAGESQSKHVSTEPNHENPARSVGAL
ncbi:MAG: hypothetical protein SFY80_15685 [Verrucomicrobiota bacterium]|nr:hypothetical protein [Verrucomicrobiota bacterium]